VFKLSGDRNGLAHRVPITCICLRLVSLMEQAVSNDSCPAIVHIERPDKQLSTKQRGRCSFVFVV
jgi:hypothetical protein